MTDELRNEYRQNITALLDNFQLKFRQGRENYLDSINNLLETIHVSFGREPSLKGKLITVDLLGLASFDQLYLH